MIADITYAHDYALRKKLWVVIVVPPEVHLEAQNALIAVANGHPFGGRTVSLGGGAKVSLVQATDPVFAEGRFEVMFAGWGGKATKAGELGRWQKAARRTVNRAV